MKKVLVLVAAIMMIAPLSVLAGMAAFMNMDEVSDTELAGTTGQAGISIAANIRQEIGYVGWGDNDGVTGSTGPGWLTLYNIALTENGVGTNWVIPLNNPITIDVCQAQAATAWLKIHIPTNLRQSVSVSQIKVGSAINTGASLGELQIWSMSLPGDIYITGHNS